MDLIHLADGRAVEYAELGDPRGRPVVHLHGSPNTAGSAVLWSDAAARRRVRLVAVSRPGYGDSATTAPGLLSVGRDVAELTDLLGLDEIAVLGVSGGGPFALAVAAAAPTRVRGVTVAAGPGPYREVAPEVLGDEDLRALELWENGDVDGAVTAVTADVAGAFDALQHLPPSDFGAAFGAMTPASERGYLEARPEDRATFFADVQRALASYAGLVRDNLSWSGRWDFDLAAVTAPVELGYGSEDSMVPLVHGEWLAARLPAARLTVHPGAGHGESTMGTAEWQLGHLG